MHGGAAAATSPLTATPIWPSIVGAGDGGWLGSLVKGKLKEALGAEPPSSPDIGWADHREAPRQRRGSSGSLYFWQAAMEASRAAHRHRTGRELK